MTTELWRHLVTWELRHTLRSAAFWFMAAIAFITPLLVVTIARSGSESFATTLSHEGAPEAVIAAELTVLSLLVCLWTVFAVKRQVASDVADDWLLVLRYRQTLVSRYVSGLAVGVLLVLITSLADLLGLCYAGAEASWFLGVIPYTLLKLVALIQPLALAAVVIAAADFLIASVPVVLFVLICLDLFWCALPVTGFAYATALILFSPANPLGWLFLGLALLVCGGAVCLGWYKAEDFWTYLRLAMDKRRESLGAVRLAIAESQRSGTVVSRTLHAASREWWGRRGVEPLAAHDLARYPWGPRKTGRSYFAWQLVALLVIAVVAAYGASSFDARQSFGDILFYFAWNMTAVIVVVRALVSGAQILVQEREQGTLASLLTTRLSTARILGTKLRVVLFQALPLLALLVVVWLLNPRYGASRGEPTDLVCWTVLAAVAGCLGSAFGGSRLMALLLGGAAMGGFLLAQQALLGVWYRGYVQAVSVGQRAHTPSDGLVAVALAILVWFIARPLAARVVQRQAGEA